MVGLLDPRALLPLLLLLLTWLLLVALDLLRLPSMMLSLLTFSYRRVHKPFCVVKEAGGAYRMGLDRDRERHNRPVVISMGFFLNSLSLQLPPSTSSLWRTKVEQQSLSSRKALLLV
jgi:hypothetical protein